MIVSVVIIGEGKGLVTMTFDSVIVVGQGGYGSKGVGQSASSLNGPQSLSVINGTLIVADTGNSRILVYAHTFNLPSVSASAVSCINSRNLNSAGSYPSNGLSGYFDSNSASYYLWASDRSLQSPSFFRYKQGWSFNQSPDPITNPISNWSQPTQITVDTKNQLLYAVDQGNNRVLQFNLNNLAVPIKIYGSSIKRISPPTDTSLYQPIEVALGCQDDIWILDAGNNRVLHYPANAIVPDYVIGQTSFTSSSSGSFASSLNQPFGVEVEDTCSFMWITDSLNNRILKYYAPFEMGMNATEVFGGTAGTSSTQLRNPYDLFIDPITSRLWIVDTGNNRVLGGITTNITVPSPSKSLTASNSPRSTSSNQPSKSSSSSTSPNATRSSNPSSSTAGSSSFISVSLSSIPSYTPSSSTADSSSFISVSSSSIPSYTPDPTYSFFCSPTFSTNSTCYVAESLNISFTGFQSSYPVIFVNGSIFFSTNFSSIILNSSQTLQSSSTIFFDGSLVIIINDPLYSPLNLTIIHYNNHSGEFNDITVINQNTDGCNEQVTPIYGDNNLNLLITKSPPQYQCKTTGPGSEGSTDSKSALSSAQIAGIVLGSIAACLLCVALIIFAFLLLHLFRRKRFRGRGSITF